MTSSSSTKILRQKLEVKSSEAKALKFEIERTRLEAQMLRLQLFCRGVQDTSMVPSHVRAGGGAEDPTAKYVEHQRLLEWLVGVCDLSSRKACNVVGDLNVAGNKAIIGHAVQWTLSVPNELFLTIPMELEATIVGMLSKARLSLLSQEELESFASEWDMISVEMNVDGEGTPGLFLLRREDNAAVVVSAWPKLPPLISASSACQPFDPAAFFERATIRAGTKAVLHGPGGVAHILSFSDKGAMWQIEGADCRPVCDLGINFSMCGAPDYEHFTLTGPFGCVAITDPRPGAPQRELVEEIVSLALEHGIHVCNAQMSTADGSADRHSPEVSEWSHGDTDCLPPVSKGDSVEVQYQGEWVSGVLQGVQGEFALVSCDADPDIITVAPLRKVRAASDGGEGDHCSEHTMNESMSPPWATDARHS